MGEAGGEPAPGHRGNEPPLGDDPGGPARTGPEAAADRLAGRLNRQAGPARRRLVASLHQLGQMDRAVYDAIASVSTPALDVPVRRLSRAADHSRIWLSIAAGLAVLGGRAGRRAAARGTLAVGASSALVNLGVKAVGRRQRPDRAGAGVPGERHVRMPSSASFPSGHSASAFAFAAAVGRDLPGCGMALGFLAAAVAYSRVHTGVHYPGDTVAGAVIGAGTGQAVAALLAPRPGHRAGRPARPAGLERMKRS